MNFHFISVSFLLWMSALLGVKDIPVEPNSDWEITKKWSKNNNGMLFKAKSQTIISQCIANPELFLHFPAIIQGAHIFKIDGVFLDKYGDEKFKRVFSFYGAPILSCESINRGKTFEWEAYSYTNYFARINSWPYLLDHKDKFNIFADISNLISSGSLFLLAIFSFIIFFRKIPINLTLSVVFSCLFFSLYFLGCVIGFLNLKIDMLTMHKIADTGVWLGFLFFINSLRIQEFFSRKIFLAYFFNVLAAIFFILIGETGDVIQFGTTLPMGFTIGIMIYSGIKSFKRILSKENLVQSSLQLFSLVFLVSATINEIFNVAGIVNGFPLLSLGMMGGLLFYILTVNNKIIETYKERDYLRSNLENEVKEQTSVIRNKSYELEKALSELKSTQAELVQSAKLASLGTLSAGIAHEINNSVNYVNGAISPLEKLLKKAISDENDKLKAEKLFNIMKEGLHLTVEIIKALRNYSGINQAKFNDLALLEVIRSVLTILKNRLRDTITVSIDIPENLTIYGSVVGLNQIFMNLISNAIDAMPDGGLITINAIQQDDVAIIEVADSGEGMSEDIQKRIFEPFFTTKPVGKGTGLGLFIINQEIKKHRGELTLVSSPGNGAKFIIKLHIKEIKNATLSEVAA